MEQFLEFIQEIFSLPIGQLNIWQFIVMLIVIAAIVGLGVLVVIGLFKFIKLFFNFFSNIFSAKKRCTKIQCPNCGRTLDKCVCAENKNRSYVARLYRYKKNQRKRK